MAAIVTPQPVSIEEYIARFVEGEEEPACEYRDGELIPKPMATRAHSKVQSNIIIHLGVHHRQTFDALPELSVRVETTRFLIPDLVIAEVARPIEGRYPGPTQPVFLCVEIMSPPDRLGKLWAKCEEYHAWGVPYCWVIDPDRKIAWEYFPADLEPRRTENTLRAGPIQIPLAEVFENL